MMKIWPVHIALLLFLLCSCSSQPSDSAVKTAIAQTQVAQPTVTSIQPTVTAILPAATAIPIKDLKLDSVIFQPGDLPAGYTQGDITHSPRNLTEDQRKLLINGIQIGFKNNGDAAGSVTVALFGSNYDRDKVYDELKESGFNDPIPFTVLTDIGEKAIQLEADVMFVRCSALTKISFIRNSGNSAALEYAKILDKRLSSLVCP